MAMARQGSSVFETAKQSLDALSGGAPTPTTPAGAAAVGGTPGQAKMAGTPAQKAPVIQQAVKPQETLAAKQRQVSAAPTVPAPDQAAAQAAREKADRLKALGSLNSRVSDLLEAKMKAVTGTPEQAGAAATSAVNEDALAAMVPDPAKRAAAKAALEAYAAGGEAGQTPEKAAAVAQQLGLESLGAGQLAALFTRAPTAIGAAAKAAVGGSQDVTLGTLDLSKITDPARLAADLGVTPDQLNAMSIDQLRDAVQGAQAREFSQADSLRAELKGASKQRAAEIRDQLKVLGAAGVSEMERGLQDLDDEIERDQEIKFDGKPVSITALLKDEGISKLITQAAQNPADLERLKTTQPELHAWIVKNQATLKAVAQDMAADVAGLEGARDTFQQATKDLSADLISKLLPEYAGKVLTPAQAAAAQQFLSSNPVFQAGQANSEILSEINKNPELIEQLKGMDPTQIQHSFDQAKALAGDDLAKSLLGITESGPFLDPATETLLKQVKDSGLYAAATKDATLLEAIRGMTPAERKQWLGKSEQEIEAGRAAAAAAFGDPILATLAGVDGSKKILDANAQQSLTAARNSPFYTNLANYPEAKALAARDPAVLAKLKAMPAQTAAEALVAGARAQTDPSLAKLLGFKDTESFFGQGPEALGGSGYILDQFDAAKKAVASKLGFEKYGPTFNDMIEKGVVTVKDLATIAKNPGVVKQAFKDAADLAEYKEKMRGADTPLKQVDQTLDYLFGEDVDLKNLAGMMEAAEVLTKTYPEYGEHAGSIKDIQNIIAGAFGIPKGTSAADFNKMLAAGGSPSFQKAMTKLAAEGAMSPEQIMKGALKGGDAFAAAGPLRDSFAKVKAFMDGYKLARDNGWNNTKALIGAIDVLKGNKAGDSTVSPMTAAARRKPGEVAAAQQKTRASNELLTQLNQGATAPGAAMTPAEVEAVLAEMRKGKPKEHDISRVDQSAGV